MAEPLFMQAALKGEGLIPEDIHIVINTHLHDDHCGNNRLFVKADCYIQRKELEACKKPHPLDYRYEPDFIEGLNLKAVEGDKEILPGLDLFLMPGHTQGGQTVRINTADGKVIIPGFCCNKENFPAEGRTAVCPGVHCDAYQAYNAAQEVKAMDGMILPLHELDITTAIKA
jgi:N-acyl homoserine lactone hydrolase